jgi:hypothetical protein
VHDVHHRHLDALLVRRQIDRLDLVSVLKVRE